MKGYRLSIIRHGRTEANSDGRYIGITDIPLSEEGKEELREKYEDNDYPKVQKVYSSPLIRCTQTAEIMFPDRHISTVFDLREMDLGDYDGKYISQLVKEKDFAEWLKGKNGIVPPNGESLEEMIKRTFAALQEILSDMMQEGLTHCAVVTHAGIMMNMLSCFGLPKMRPMEFASEVGEGYEILITPQMWMNSGVFEIMGKIPYTAEFDDGYDF